MATNGQVYDSDRHQVSIYPDGYHRAVDRASGHQGSEMITEIYVPRDKLTEFMAEAAEDFRRNHVEVIYGTVRLIRKDTESFMAWARQDYACVIFNLHVDHSPAGYEAAAEAFRRLINMAIKRTGNYYLTYHRWAAREQVLTCYPQFPQFLRLKKRYDPDERIQSEWYRHYSQMLA
jgi:FAD/FMN-containing dehydrogenase